MPVSDNLYSADDSDGESFSEELTPTNGYFHRGEMAPRAMLHDPQLQDDKTPEPKVLVPIPNARGTPRPSTAANHPALSQFPPLGPHAMSVEDTMSNATPLPRHTETGPSLEPSREPNEQAAMGGPPPAYTRNPTPNPVFQPTSSRYTPSDASSRPLQEPQSPRRYSTFSEQPQLERGFLLPLRTPESMGGEAGGNLDERTPLRGDESVKPSRSTALKRVFVLAVVFIALVGTIVTLFHVKTNNSPRLGRPTKERLLDDTGPYCSSATIRRDPVVYEFPVGGDLKVLQITHDNDRSRRLARVQTTGEIRMRALNQSFEHGDRPHFTVNVHVSDSALQVVRTWDESSRILKISTPKYADLDPSISHCISLEITAWVPEGAVFEDISLGSISLDTRIIDDIDINVSGETKIASISGDIWFPLLEDMALLPVEKIARSHLPVVMDGSETYTQDLLLSLSTPDPIHPFASRRILVETVTGEINGVYPLLDFLGLSSQSGSISVGVLPQKVLPDAPAPADLEVQTASGSIQISVPVASEVNPDYIIPPRNYITNVHSNSGAIRGFFYLGSLGSFKSTTGSLKLRTLPIIPSEDSGSVIYPCRFETHTVSGSTDVEVLDPIFIARISSAEQTVGKATPAPDFYNPIGDHEPYLTIPPTRALYRHSAILSVKKLRTLQSKHTSNSASVAVVYPSGWEGSVHAKTVSGDITVSGSGVRTIRERKGWAYKEILARKGVDHAEQGSMAEMSDIAGDLRFKIGNTY
ncbi:hypothetical protein GLAREA_04638 [Glarea lozoyensis ATCC 20868]|uniref:Adhesin domain-containing protein n=1 Tax=Glarea lozoyensis (strain ATCC 20868 / MF5171) TaxID=1116229 RepID=S3CN07_GLAL2|nr:uncharacterized protein GLAREA_04638 [Glarea lozoyensis ATCC 20868]EPE27847.1 hypothetical protein GLAREA_04638 [Glarea lozoyensis ATCC 20868]